MVGLIARRRGNVGILLASLIAAASLTVWAAPAPASANFCIVQPGYKCWTVTINLSGNGTGTFKTTDSTYNTPDGLINCDRAGGVTTGSCAFTYQVASGTNFDVYWQARAATGSQACVSSSSCGSYQDFQTTISGPATIAVISFSLTSPITLSVSTAGSGKGVVTSTPTGISCGLSCSDQFASGQPLTLSAQSITGSVFGGWSNGPCQGQGSVCHFSPTGTSNIVATFNPAPAATAAAKATSATSPTPDAASSASPAGSPSEVVAAASAGTPSAPAASQSPTDLTPVAIGIVIAALILAAAIMLGLVIGLRPRRRDRPQT